MCKFHCLLITILFDTCKKIECPSLIVSIMYNESEKEWILEAINHLKRRKARPDFTRISLRMKRKHQFTFIQTRRLLDSLVESGFVVKAVYKNNTSYRDVSKWKKGRLGGQILNSSKMLKRFVNAIWANESDNKGTGVSVKQIEQWFKTENEDKCFLSGAALKDAIENEVTNGYLGRITVDSEDFYTVNTDRLKEINGLVEESYTGEQRTDMISQSDSEQEELNESQSKLGENLTSNLMMAISETENDEGKGSSVVQIKNWMIRNECFGSCQNSESLLLESIENEVDKNKGLIKKLVNKDVILYAVNEHVVDEHAVDGDDLSDHSILLNNSDSGAFNLKRDDKKSHSHSTSPNNTVPKKKKSNQEAHKIISQMQSKATISVAPVSLRPPSKRKVSYVIFLCLASYQPSF